MKTLEELVDKEAPFFNVMNEWVAESKNHVEVLPPSSDCAQVLLDVQVTTHSILGSLIYLLIDHGWITGSRGWKQSLSSRCFKLE